ncbi:MAG: hypothetical protein ACPLPX_09150 [Candidatus Kapaibacteriota bacterium]
MHKFGRLFLPAAIILLIFGIIAGLERGGVLHLNLKLYTNLGNLHYLIFFAGFFGTLLSVESAVGQGEKILFLIPATLIAGLLLYILSGLSFLLIIGSLAFSVPSFIVFIKRKEYITFVLSCLLFALGTLFYIYDKYYPSAIAYLYFLIFYILSERFELAKIVGASKKSFRHFLANEIIVVILVVFSLFDTTLALRFAGFVTFLLTLWFVQNDLARKTVKSREPAKYSAIAMLSGYLWLAIGNLLFIISPSTFWSEAVHSITLGFVFSMVFAHAPIIFPNVGRFKFFFSKWLYIPLIILHLSVILRVSSYFLPTLKPHTLYLNFFAIIFFFSVFILLALRIKRIEDKTTI